MPAKGRRETLGCNPTAGYDPATDDPRRSRLVGSERNLTDVKHLPTGMMCAAEQADAIIQMVERVRAAALDSTIRLIDDRLEQLHTHRPVDAVGEMRVLRERIRALKEET